MLRILFVEMVGVMVGFPQSGVRHINARRNQHDSLHLDVETSVTLTANSSSDDLHGQLYATKRSAKRLHSHGVEYYSKNNL